MNMTPRERQLRDRALMAKGSENWSFAEFKEYWTIYAENNHASKSAILSLLKGLKRFKIVTQMEFLLEEEHEH